MAAGQEGEMIGDALRMIRVFHDIPQKRLAEQLKMSASHLSEVESNKKKPTLDLLDRYAEVFKIPVSSIMFFSEEMGNGTTTDKIRVSISEKVLALLKFIAIRAGKEAA